jgi:hypothetical protein
MMKKSVQFEPVEHRVARVIDFAQPERVSLGLI